jgi:multicomponent Na+:H+ antiporter subunit D
MLDQLFILFIILPLLTAIALFAIGTRSVWQQGVSLAVVLLLWGFALYGLIHVLHRGMVVLRLGHWPAPYGIILVADVLSMTMVAVTMTIALAVTCFSLPTVDRARQEHFYYPLFFILLMGVNGAFLTGDIFNLFVFFEVLLIASYALMALGSDADQLRETNKYVVLNLIASTVFLFGLSATYRIMGTLNMADLALKMQTQAENPLLTVLAMVFLFVFGTKAAIFPLYFWLPGPYYPPPAGISAFFGGILTKVGVYAIFRTFTLLFRHDPSFTHELLLAISAATMIFGVLGAISQLDIKRILSYHIISQIGYMILGIGLFVPQALAGALFYIVHHVIVKSALFLISGVVQETTGTTSLKALGGLSARSWLLSALFLVAALSLAGLPPLSGFFSKLIILQAGVNSGRYGYVAVGLLGSLLTLFSMLKIWNGVFWGEERAPARPVPLGPLLPGVILLVSLTMGIGLFPRVLYRVVDAAATQLADPWLYITAVLGPGVHQRGTLPL